MLCSVPCAPADADSPAPPPLPPPPAFSHKVTSLYTRKAKLMGLGWTDRMDGYSCETQFNVHSLASQTVGLDPCATGNIMYGVAASCMTVGPGGRTAVLDDITFMPPGSSWTALALACVGVEEGVKCFAPTSVQVHEGRYMGDVWYMWNAYGVCMGYVRSRVCSCSCFAVLNVCVCVCVCCTVLYTTRVCVFASPVCLASIVCVCVSGALEP